MAGRKLTDAIIRQYRQSPTFLLASWFFAFLTAGTLLLLLPAAVVSPERAIDLSAALFTAASAFCVTGLTVVETSDTFSLFGQFVILLLMELGGIGVMTFASLAFNIMGRRMSMNSRAALADTLFQNDAAREFRTIFSSMIKAVALIQLAGVAVIFISLSDGPGTPREALWSAVFHSVSAFCNAGFSIYRDNLVPMAGNRLFLSAIAALVVLGGLGFCVLGELYRFPSLIGGMRKKPRWFSLNSRTVLYCTGGLLAVGAVSVVLSDSLLGDDGVTTAFDSAFHSVVARTAGFNSAPLGGIPLTSCLLLCILMFIGGAPGSCAGGIKVTSLAIWFARISANLRHENNVNILGFTIDPHLVGKARVIMALSTLWVVAGTLFLSVSEPDVQLHRLLFEQVSALGTVGLSMGLTPELNEFSRMWIIASMILGKFGPLTIALWMIKPAPRKIARPEGRIMIG